jgi:hypothetical protein
MLIFSEPVLQPGQLTASGCTSRSEASFLPVLRIFSKMPSRQSVAQSARDLRFGALEVFVPVRAPPPRP